MTALESIVLGVVSGVLTSTLLYLFGLLIKRHLVPWYQALTYRGVDISGIWIAEVEAENTKAKMEMNITQHAHSLLGCTTIVQGKDLNNPTSITNLDMKGGVWEGFLTLNMQSQDRTRLSYSTSLLEVLNGGLTLKGCYLYRSIQSDEIRSTEVIWRRKK